MFLTGLFGFYFSKRKYRSISSDLTTGLFAELNLKKMFCGYFIPKCGSIDPLIYFRNTFPIHKYARTKQPRTVRGRKRSVSTFIRQGAILPMEMDVELSSSIIPTFTGASPHLTVSRGYPSTILTVRYYLRFPGFLFK